MSTRKKKGRVARRKRNKNGARDRRERDTDDRKHGARKDARRIVWRVGSEYVVPKRAGDVSGRRERRLIRRYERKAAIGERDEGYGRMIGMVRWGRGRRAKGRYVALHHHLASRPPCELWGMAAFPPRLSPL